MINFDYSNVFVKSVSKSPRTAVGSAFTIESMNDLIPPVTISDEQKQRAANVLHSLPFTKLMGMQLVELRSGEAVIRIDMRDDLRQPSGVLHGGVTATLIDTAMA